MILIFDLLRRSSVAGELEVKFRDSLPIKSITRTSRSGQPRMAFRRFWKRRDTEKEYLLSESDTVVPEDEHGR